MKNRLADLIRVALMVNIDKSCRLAENIADHLLENGVIVPLISGKGETELKPCPFCGSEDLEIEDDLDECEESRYYWVACNSCGGLGASVQSKDECIERWNRRAEQ